MTIALTCHACHAAYSAPLQTCPRCGGALSPAVAKNQDGATGAEHTVNESDDSVSDATAALGEELAFLGPSQVPGEFGRLGGYRILGILGKGGMGMVLQAEDLKLRRHVALKVIRPSATAKATAQARFLREARAQAAVEHPNIIPIYEVDEDRGFTFIAMPVLKGRLLNARLKDEGRLPILETLRIGREIAEGLAAAHEKKLIHRDLKPANIWLEGSKQTVKLLDFGLARVEGEEAKGEHLTEEGTVVGTPSYMSPEQARGTAVDARSDLWSLGVILYQMTTGQLPFIADTSLGVLTTLVLEEPQQPSAINPVIPPGVEQLILHLLTKAAQGRPQTAAEVIRRLADLEVSLRTTAEKKAAGAVNPWRHIDDSGSSPKVVVVRKPALGNSGGSMLPVWLAVGAAVVLVVGVLGGIGWWLTRSGATKESVADDKGPAVVAAPASKPTGTIKQPVGPDKKPVPADKPKSPWPQREAAQVSRRF